MLHSVLALLPPNPLPPPSPAGLFSNRFFLYAVGGSIAGQVAVIYFPPLQAVFQTVPLSLWDWLYITCIASTVLLVDEARKLLRAARSAKQALVPSLLARVCGRGRKKLRYGYARLVAGAGGGAGADDYKRTDSLQPDSARLGGGAAGGGGVARGV